MSGGGSQGGAAFVTEPGTGAATNLAVTTELDKKAHKSTQRKDPDTRSSHKLSHKAEPVPPDSPHKAPRIPPTPTPAAKKKATTDLTRCYQVGCNAQVGQAGGKANGVLGCLSKATSKEEGAKCLGPEDASNPANDLRTCMICHKCIEGHLKDPSVCDTADTSWNNKGASWIG